MTTVYLPSCNFKYQGAEIIHNFNSKIQYCISILKNNCNNSCHISSVKTHFLPLIQYLHFKCWQHHIDSFYTNTRHTNYGFKKLIRNSWRFKTPAMSTNYICTVMMNSIEMYIIYEEPTCSPPIGCTTKTLASM